MTPGSFSASRALRAVAAAFIVVLVASGSGVAADTVTCEAARTSGTAPVGCSALKDLSPYVTGGLGGTRIGANAASLASVTACVEAGDTRSTACSGQLPLESAYAGGPGRPVNVRVVP